VGGTNRREFSQAIVRSAGVILLGRVEVEADKRTSEFMVSDGSITDVPGIKVGHFTDSRRPTGCTAILFDGEATAGVDYDGSAPGSYLGVLLQPVSPIETIQGMLLTGGGPMGLAAVPGAGSEAGVEAGLAVLGHSSRYQPSSFLPSQPWTRAKRRAKCRVATRISRPTRLRRKASG